MSISEFCGLLLVWLISTGFILWLTWCEFRRVKFNFNVFFSLLFLLTFYFGFPFTAILAFRFNVEVVSAGAMLQALLTSTCFYAIYYTFYKTRLLPGIAARQPSRMTINRLEAHMIWGILAIVSLGAVGLFFLHNGFLLFRLSSYSQIFSSQVSGVALKRFFYFFIPAMLIVYFLRQNVKSWILFLASTLLFGILTYTVVGGTRANIVIAFALFLFIGMIRGWISLGMLMTAGMAAIVGMFWLALRRYNLDVNGEEAFYTFLYLTRDTFSPWENLALLLENYDQIEFQGLAPIIRDFYVFIPGWLWADRPQAILNTGNYFTWEVLNNHSGLAISPTLIGSLVVMGGIALIPVGAIVVGLIIKGFDWLYELGKSEPNTYQAAIIQSFCFSAVFNMIVLVREGLDAFVSRVTFFCLVFIVCVVLAKILYEWLYRIGLTRPQQRKTARIHQQKQVCCRSNQQDVR